MSVLAPLSFTDCYCSARVPAEPSRKGPHCAEPINSPPSSFGRPLSVRVPLENRWFLHAGLRRGYDDTPSIDVSAGDRHHDNRTVRACWSLPRHSCRLRERSRRNAGGSGLERRSVRVRRGTEGVRTRPTGRSAGGRRCACRRRPNEQAVGDEAGALPGGSLAQRRGRSAVRTATCVDGRSHSGGGRTA